MNFKFSNPDPKITDFVERFWAFENNSEEDIELIVVPDGRIDVIFTFSPSEPFTVGLIGLETMPSSHIFPVGTVIFGVSLKLLSIEYLIKTDIAHLVNGIQLLPEGFWEVEKSDLNNFDLFCQKNTKIIIDLIPQNIDGRKTKLFNFIYSTNGAMSVKELSEKVFWSSRQINRYFTQKFGITLKFYCNILRFKASFPQIKEGKLFPKENFSDQAHFIREVKKLSGVSPKELFKNKNDRFIQLSTLPKD